MSEKNAAMIMHQVEFPRVSGSERADMATELQAVDEVGIGKRKRRGEDLKWLRRVDGLDHGLRGLNPSPGIVKK